MAVLEDEPIMASESEEPALYKIKGVLDNGNDVPKLVGPDGEIIELPRTWEQRVNYPRSSGYSQRLTALPDKAP